MYAIPAIGFSVPIGGAESRWRFGLSAYGISGLGVDYRDTDIDQPDFYSFPSPPFPAGSTAPAAAGTYTNLQLMKFAPTIGWQATNQFSVGAAFHINYTTLDLGDGSSAAYSYGVQLGALYKPLDQLSLGLTYVSPQEAKYDNVADLDGDGARDNLKLEQPQQVALGIAYEFLKPGILLEVNGRWIDWSNSKGFEDFDWRDQYVLALGGQWEVIDHLFLRAGYNYAKNPLKSHNGWNGNFLQPGGPDRVNVQGKGVPVYFYETLRTVGFPALVEHHITTGIGYEFGENLIINLSYMHAFENSITETGIAADGSDAKIESKLYEDSLSFSFSWRF
jgi:long-chain fatty acid transport protein